MRSEGGSVVRTLVSIDNGPSLNLSRKCGYEIGDVWNWYTVKEKFVNKTQNFSQI